MDGRIPMETVLMKELLPHIDAMFCTTTSKEARLVEGFSMGGYGAARLGFKYPDVFGAASILGGGPLQQTFDIHTAPRNNAAEVRQLMEKVLGEDQDYFRAQSPWVLAEQNAASIRGKLRVRMVIGDRDDVYASNRKFDAHLTELHIPHADTALPGVRHNPGQLLKALGEENWPFYRDVFGDVQTMQAR